MFLQKTVIRSLGFVFLSKNFIKIITISSSILLMRVLSPEDFGIFALGTLVILFFTNIQNFGLNAAIIREDEKNFNNDYISSAFTLKLLVSFVIFAVVFLISPYWADFYGYSEIELIIKILALIFLLKSVSFISDSLLRRNLEFKKLSAINIITTLSRVLLTLIFAYSGNGLWSLVYGHIFGEVINVLLLIYFQKWNFSLGRNINIMKTMFSFGFWVLLSGLIFSTYTLIDNAVVGQILGATALGHYVVAYRWGHFTSDNIKNAFIEVMFPTFSIIKSDIAKISFTYLECQKYITYVVAPISVGWIAMGDLFLISLAGEVWYDAIVPLQILACSGFLRSLHIGGVIFPVIGNPQFNTRFNFFQMVLILLSIYPMTASMGLLGASLTITLTFTVSTLVLFFYMSRLLNLDFKDILKPHCKPLISSIIMGLYLYVIKIYLLSFTPLSSFIIFLSLFITSFAFYFSSLAIISNGESNKDFKSLVQMFSKSNHAE